MTPLLSAVLLVGCPDPEETTRPPPGPTGLFVDDTGGSVATGPMSERFAYEQPEIDVLFVIDASCSMISQRETLLASVDGLIRDWDDLGFAYHVGVADIDHTDETGELEQSGGYRWADPDHPTPAQLLSTLVGNVAAASSVESGRGAVWRTFQLADEPGEFNYGFLRDDSQVSIIVHTDANDQGGNTPISQPDFIDWLKDFRPEGDILFHSIAATQDYADVSNAVGGVVWSVDNTPYGPALQAITDQFHEAPLVLGAVPDEASFVVHVITDGNQQLLAEDQYTFDSSANALVLDHGHAISGDIIEVSYDVAPTAP